MCVNFIAWKVHPKYPILIAGNRDEFYSRPSERATFNEDNPDILCGLDLLHGGTWLGITTSGRFGMLTNFREVLNHDHSAPSRGHLVLDFLKSNLNATDYIYGIENVDSYNGFNLMLFDGNELVYFSNKTEGYKILEPGIYGMSNGLLDDHWFKVIRGISNFNDIISEGINSSEEFFKLLKDQNKSPDNLLPSTGLDLQLEREVSSIFIRSPKYGTCASTVIIRDSDGLIKFWEKQHNESGSNPEVSFFEFIVSDY